MEMIIGLDVHGKSTVYFAQDIEGEKLGEGSVQTTLEGLNEMLEKLGASEGSRIGLETGTQATFVSHFR